MNEKNHSLHFLIPLLILSLSASIILFASTSLWGLGASSDASNYIAGARNILSGRGYRSFGYMTPIIRWPPFFSFSLAAIGLSGMDPLVGVRWLHVVLFGVNIFLIGTLLKKFTGSALLSLAGAYLAMTSIPMVTIHGMAMSEPWFILFTFLAFYCLSQCLGEKPKYYLVLASILTGLACLDRFAGIAIIATGAFMLLFFQRKSFVLRLRDSFIYTLASSLPLALWLLRNRMVAGSISDRMFNFQLPSSSYWTEALDTLSSWILPEQFPAALRYFFLGASILALAILAVIVILKNAARNPNQNLIAGDSFRFPVSMLIFILCTTGLELSLRMFIDPGAHANHRHFSAIFIAGLLGAFILLNRFLKTHSRGPMINSAVWGALILLGFSYTSTYHQKLTQLYQSGVKYTGRQWHMSPVVEKVKTLPPDAIIYTNEPSVIYLLTNRNAMQLPHKVQTKRGKTEETAAANKDFLKDLKIIERQLFIHEGYIVFFKQRERWHKASKSDLLNHLSLVAVHELPDGTIYRVGSSSLDIH